MIRSLGGLLAISLTAACASPGTSVPEPDDTEHDLGEIPPQGRAALVAWLADGHYLSWNCEPDPHPARPPGAHGSNRICSNAALAGSSDGIYPVGAASVKELFSGGAITGFAVGRKVTTGSDAASWYWYEAFGTNVVADSVGAGLCAGCHAGAPRDNVFTQVR
jgi:hypothetical protein